MSAQRFISKLRDKLRFIDMCRVQLSCRQFINNRDCQVRGDFLRQLTTSRL